MRAESVHASDEVVDGELVGGATGRCVDRGRPVRGAHGQRFAHEAPSAKGHRTGAGARLALSTGMLSPIPIERACVASEADHEPEKILDSTAKRSKPRRFSSWSQPRLIARPRDHAQEHGDLARTHGGSLSSSCARSAIARSRVTTKRCCGITLLWTDLENALAPGCSAPALRYTDSPIRAVQPAARARSEPPEA